MTRGKQRYLVFWGEKKKNKNKNKKRQQEKGFPMGLIAKPIFKKKFGRGIRKR